MVVYKSDGTIRGAIDPSSNDIQNKSINGVDLAVINWLTPVPLDFEIGDYINILNDVYTLNSRINRARTFKRSYEYTLPFEGQSSKLGRANFLFLDNFNRFTKSFFFLNAKPIDFLNLIVANMNRVFPEMNWVRGNCIDDKFANIQFNGVNCLDAINTIAEQYSTEYLIEKTPTSYRISLYRREVNTGFVLRFGALEGLHSIEELPQDNSNPVNKLYAYGSNKNIGSNYRLGEERLRMEGDRFVTQEIPMVHGTFEKTIAFEDIYPHRTGKVSSVDTPFIFADDTIDFNLNSYNMPNDVKPKVVFLTGLLSGYTFTVSNFNNTTKKFTIEKNTQEQTVEVPSLLMSPQVGDEYTIVDILMPDSYIVAAEKELKERAMQWLQDNGLPKVKYNVVCNPFWMRKYSATLKLGDIITLDVPEMGINLQIRVITINRNIIKPYIYAIELSDRANPNILVNIITGL